MSKRIAEKAYKLRQRASDESDKVLGAEVGRALLSATMGRDAHIKASISNFSDPIATANEQQRQTNERAALQTQILAELDTFLGIADLTLLKLKLQQQKEQNQKLIQRNQRIARRTTNSLVRAAHTGDSSILLQQLSTNELESIKLASMHLSGGESDTGGEKSSMQTETLTSDSNVTISKKNNKASKDMAKASNRRRKERRKRKDKRRQQKSSSPDRGRELFRSSRNKNQTSTKGTETTENISRSKSLPAKER
jgi:hypothetical protein|tara:strand:+ start:86 stop:844 length:759 start_codon:yes stop_codon:yes gene_type:complete